MDNLVVCKRCNSDACYEVVKDEVIYWNCFGCGFQSNSTLETSNPNLDQVVEVLPNLYKDLRFIDKTGHCWFPATLNLPGKGMVFVDGKNVEDWQWAAVKADVKDPIKMNMKTIKHFSRDYMEALDYINYFK